MRIHAKILVFVAATTAISGAPAPAHAAADFQRVSRPVIYSDLNLRAAAGRAELQKRIEAAARLVCNQTPGQSLAEVTHRRNCRAAAVDAAARQAAAIAG